ncbi:MAG: lysostaphin resistance A-like protein [Pyrinomonadaceae bacterium]
MQNIDQTESYPKLPQPVDSTPPVYRPTPKDPPWGVLEGIGVWIVSVLFILIIPTIFLLPYLATQNASITDNEQLIDFAKTDPTSILLQIAGIIPAHVLTVLLAWLVVTRFRKYSFRKTLGWESGGFRWWHYCIILGAFFVLAAIVGNYFPEKENDLIRMLHSSRLAVYIVAFVATFTAPFVEEVVYRGILYSAFQRTLGVPAAFLLVTFLFAVVHVPQYYPSFSTIFLLGVLSLILTSIRVKTNSLLPCIILHTLFNGIQSVFLLVEPLMPSPDVQQQAPAVFHFLK